MLTKDEAWWIAVNIAKAAGVHPQATQGRVMVCQPLTGKAVANEKEYPYIVELAVAADKLEVELSRRMMDFHRSRKIQARHGRKIVQEGQIYYRWCFSDLATARAFMEQFGGEVLQTESPKG